MHVLGQSPRAHLLKHRGCWVTCRGRTEFNQDRGLYWTWKQQHILSTCCEVRHGIFAAPCIELPVFYAQPLQLQLQPCKRGTTLTWLKTIPQQNQCNIRWCAAAMGGGLWSLYSWSDPDSDPDSDPADACTCITTYACLDMHCFTVTMLTSLVGWIFGYASACLGLHLHTSKQACGARFQQKRLSI